MIEGDFMPENKSSEHKLPPQLRLFLLITLLVLGYNAIEYGFYGLSFPRLSQRSYHEMMDFPPAADCKISIFVHYENQNSTEYYAVEQAEDRAAIMEVLSHLEYDGYYGGKNSFPRDLGTYYVVDIYCGGNEQIYLNSFYLGKYAYGDIEDFFLRSYSAKFSNAQLAINYLDNFVARVS